MYPYGLLLFSYSYRFISDVMNERACVKSLHQIKYQMSIISICLAHRQLYHNRRKEESHLLLMGFLTSSSPCRFFASVGGALLAPAGALPLMIPFVVAVSEAATAAAAAAVVVDVVVVSRDRCERVMPKSTSAYIGTIRPRRYMTTNVILSDVFSSNYPKPKDEKKRETISSQVHGVNISFSLF